MAVAITKLGEVLAYRNEDLVSRFSEDFDISIDAAEAIFLETKKWLWLCATQSYQNSMNPSPTPPLTLFQEMLVIDLMWHNFILFTHEYADFCNRYFGAFIHHVPKTNRDAALSLADQRARLQSSYEFIYDNLGGDTLLYWSETLPLKFASIKEK